MVVAALVCTITFSVVFQIPGGFDQKNGFPIFLHDKNFNSFLTMDAFSFLFAAMAVILFEAAILYRKHGNMKALYVLWVYGQLALLASITAAVNAFIISFSILYRKSSWMVTIYAVAYPIMLLFFGVTFYIIFDTITAQGFILNLYMRKQHKLFRRD
ncbi:putative PGG domain-containing protein [Helianthus anomalus]